MASRVSTILAASIAAHGAIAIWALCGDPIVDRPVMAATSGREFQPDRVRDEIVAEYDFDATSMPPLLRPNPGPQPRVTDPTGAAASAAPVAPPTPPPPAPLAPTRAPAPARLGTAPRAPHAPGSPGELREPSARAIVDGLFSDDHGLAPGGDLARRRPGGDLAHQIDVARQHGGAASIDGGDPRFRGDDRARLGTGTDCACDPDPTPRLPATPPPDIAPPTIRVEPPRAVELTTLSPEEVLRIVTSTYLAGLERCQRELMRTGADAAGKVTLELSIDGDGATAGVSADGVADALDRCIEARAGGWHFPAPHDAKTGAATTARYRLSLALQAR